MDLLVQIDAYDPVPDEDVTLTASSIDDDRVCHLNGATWWPAIATLPTLRWDGFDGAFGGQIEAPSSSLAIAVETWPDFARYAFTDARIRLWTGEAGDVWGSWTLRFDGRVDAQPVLADGIAQISFSVDDRWLDAALLDTYDGTTGAEGSAAQTGVAKPLAIGRPRFVPGVLIDQTNTVTQLSSAGLIEDVEVAFEKLSRFGASIGDYASYAALVAASIPAGRWGTAKAVGMVRHGAPFNGKATYHVKGDKSGPDGWARLPGEVVRRLALLSGGTGKIDDTSLDALDLARPWNQSLYLDSQTTAREQIQRLSASINAVANVDFLGKLYVTPIDAGLLSSPVLTLAPDGSALPPVANVQQIAMGVPWWQLAITAERAWSPYALSEVAFTGELVLRGDYDPATAYKEGDIVFQPTDGRQYLYINPTSTAGNAPPDLTYWAVYQSADGGIAGNANRVPYSRFEGASVGSVWGVHNPDGIATSPLSGATSVWLGRNFYKGTFTAATAGQLIALFENETIKPFPVTPGERLSCQVGIEAAGPIDYTDAYIQFFDTAGAYLPGDDIQIGALYGVQSYNTKMQAFGLVPAGATRARLIAFFHASGAGSGSGVIIEPMVTEAGVDQSTHPSFSPGPNSEDGADITGVNTAANTSAVGAAASGTVEAGATAANNAANSDGTIKNDRVGTDAIQADAISERTFANLGSSFSLSTSNQLILDITLSAAVAGEAQEFNGTIDGFDTNYEGDFTTINMTVVRCDTGGTAESTIVSDRSIGTFSDENVTNGFSARFGFINTPTSTYRRYKIYARHVDSTAATAQTSSYVMSGAMKK